MVAFVDIAYVKSLPSGARERQFPVDERLQEIIEVASEFIERYLERHIAVATITERKWGGGWQRMILEEMPIITLNSVTEISLTGGTTMIDPSSFVLHRDAGMIEWANLLTKHFRSDRVYLVNYTAGYATIPAPIRHATALQVHKLLYEGFAGRIVEPEGLIDIYDEKIAELLEPYRRKRIA